MKISLLALTVGVGLTLMCGCNDSLSSSGGASGPNYLQSDVGVIKYVNESQRNNTYIEVETELGNILLLTKSTEVFLQAADFSGFDNSGVAPDIRYSTILHPGQTVRYYYEMGNVNYAAAKSE